jgi:hypothetical protein
MSGKNIRGLAVFRSCQTAPVVVLAGSWLAGLWLALVRADEPAADADKGAPAAKSASATGSMVRRTGPDKPWQPVAKDEDLHAGEMIVGQAGAVIASSNGAVRFTLQTDLEGKSPYPIIETGVRLGQPSKGMDLDLTLDRGRIDLTNTREQGAARIRLHVRQDSWDLTLAEAGSDIAVELYGRWPRGVPFNREPNPKEAPTANVVFLVLKGKVYLAHKGIEHILAAPPGPAMISWDSVHGQDETAQALKDLPPWAMPEDEDSPVVKARRATRLRFRKALVGKTPEAALDELVDSDNPDDRTMAVFAMGALDDLSGLGKALRQSKHPDVWDNGVIALRHWIGRGPGQDQILYKRLIEVGKFSPVDAETVMQLLHSYGETELARPETYETLIDYLDHDNLAIRGLAYWHLSRLVPAGKEFGYQAQAPKEERDAAVKKWRKLIPPGQMPPKTKVDTGKK